MKYIIESLKDNDIKKIIEWKYDGEYSIYNFPSYKKLMNCNSSFVDKNKRDEFRIIKNNNEIIGWFRFIKEKDNYLGLGMNPEYCGKGNGKQFIKTIIDYLNSDYINLEVRDFNVRAIKCYKSCGFKVIEEYLKETPNGVIKYIKMKYEK